MDNLYLSFKIMVTTTVKTLILCLLMLVDLQKKNFNQKLNRIKLMLMFYAPFNSA